MSRLLHLPLLAALLAFSPRAMAEPPVVTADVPALKKAMVLQHAKIIHANYTDCLTAARTLQTAVRDFLAAPDAVKLAAARKAWTLARQPYLQSEAYRFYAGPIDDADGPEPLLNSWPLDEAFIDAPDTPEPGIIGNIRDYPQLTAALIKSLNQADGEKNVACGWHAVEFLLWGQDRSATGPGDRPVTDFTIETFARRRGQFLQACTDLIVQQLEELTADWAPDDLGNYRAVFEEGIDYSVERILMGLTFLSENELAGARLQVAYDTKDQENEHSCFSDTSHQDSVFDATGMRNVWRGTYTGLDGKTITGSGLREVCLALNHDLGTKLDELIEGNVAKANAVPQPFDQAILGSDDTPGRKAVMALIVSFEDTGINLRKLAQALKIEIPETPPEGIEG